MNHDEYDLEYENIMSAYDMGIINHGQMLVLLKKLKLKLDRDINDIKRKTE